MTTGKCERCALLYAWNGKPLLRDAHCQKCGDKLARTSYQLRGYNHTMMRPSAVKQAKA